MAIDELEAKRAWSPEQVAELLQRLEARPLSREEQQALLACHASLKAVKYPSSGAAVYCPWCGLEQLSRPDATWHIERCERHPGRVRYQRLGRVAARLFSRAGRQNDLAPVPPPTFVERDPDFLVFEDFATAVQRLSAPQSADTADAVWTLQRELRWRLHTIDRSTDPCPWCRAVFPMEAFIEHLWACPQHPGGRLSDVLLDGLLERFGDDAVREALEEDRELEARATLGALIAASRTYAAGMGLADGGKYSSKKWSERPWMRALRLAEHFARDEQKVPMRPALERLVLAIATLVQQCMSFWNGMDDDEDGRSLIDPECCESWEAQVAAAETSLAATWSARPGHDRKW